MFGDCASTKGHRTQKHVQVNEVKDKHSYREYEGKLDNAGVGLRVIRWNDNEIVNIMSSFGSALPLGTCQRWDRSLDAYRKVTVPCPNLVSYYNQHMGGIDKMDSLLGLYRIFFRGKKWYLRIFFHLVDLSLNNAWLPYRRDFELLGESGKTMSLYEFKSNVSFCLRNKSKPLNKIGRPASLAKEVRLHSGARNKKKVPPSAIVEDQVGHFPISLPSRGRCRNTPCKGSVVTYCVKCEVYLCIGPGPQRQCFTKFHGVDIDLTNLPHLR